MQGTFVILLYCVLYVYRIRLELPVQKLLLVRCGLFHRRSSTNIHSLIGLMPTLSPTVRGSSSRSCTCLLHTIFLNLV